MDYRKAYLDLRERQQQEVNNFPMFFAFNDHQFEEGLAKLGVTIEDIVSYSGIGDYMRKTDLQAFKDMTIRHTKEVHEALKDQKFAFAAFLYEMDNHEYAINWEGDTEVLGCLGLNKYYLKEFGLESTYRRAIEAHMEYAKDW